MNDIVSKIKKSNLISKGSTVVLGLSGGPDSITLLYALHEMAEDFSLRLVPVHVNHQLRENANAEEKHIAKICQDLGTPCRIERIDCRQVAKMQNLTLEEAGRKERYRIFDKVCNKLMQDGISEDKILIAVAHNADDQCETLLQRIVRGTGMKGLGGIPFRRTSEAGFEVVRPLLKISRTEIEAYVAEHHLEPNYDESNESMDYTRNRIRLQLIPYLEEYFNPNVKGALQNLQEIAAEEESYMQTETQRALEEICLDAPLEEICIDVPKLCNLHLAIGRRVIAEMLRRLGMEEQLQSVHVSAILEAAKGSNPSASIDLPQGLQAKRRYDKLVIRRPERTIPGEEESELQPIPSRQMIQNRMHISVQNIEQIPTSCKNPHACYDYDAFIQDGYSLEDVRIRTRMPGDRIAIGGGKHKKLQNYMVDEKIPKEFRDSIFVAAVGNEILWILPNEHLTSEVQRNKGKFSQKYQIHANCKRALFLEFTLTV